ncbi:MAG TPA: transcription antitermination factor NusB [Stellaceae bacterium]|nr:transcription antitermination factor NusB [Stellaceae bacterium]
MNAAPAVLHSARGSALALLEAVLGRKIPLDQALAENKPLAALEPRDRGFARMLAATSLRRLGQIDAVLAQFMAKPLPERAGVVRDILRLGSAQLLFLETPPHAAVATAVELTEAAGHPALKGLVNAVLRRLSREGKGLVEKQDAARLNTPDWLWASWTKSYGEDIARQIALAHLKEAPLDLSVKSDPELWAEKLQAQILPTGTLRRASGGAIEDLPGYREGAWWVQDAAAALPARLLGNVAGKSVADLCAAPGGKTAQLAAQGGRVFAVDRSNERLKRVRENLARLGLEAECVTADASIWKPASPLRFVLLDAPCTATGAIRRNPDVPHLKTPDDVKRMAELQDRLLAHAVSILAPGGLLVYCTCSLEVEEGPARIEKLLAGGAPVSRRPIAAFEIGGWSQCLSSEGDLRTLPCQLADAGGLDGFYAARLARNP